MKIYHVAAGGVAETDIVVSFLRARAPVLFGLDPSKSLDAMNSDPRIVTVCIDEGHERPASVYALTLLAFVARRRSIPVNGCDVCGKMIVHVERQSHFGGRGVVTMVDVDDSGVSEQMVSQYLSNMDGAVEAGELVAAMAGLARAFPAGAIGEMAISIEDLG